jgi:hypothetical protein
MTHRTERPEPGSQHLEHQLLRLLERTRTDAGFHETLQALVILSIATSVHDEHNVDLDMGLNIADMLRELWQIAYLEGFEDGRVGGSANR